MMPAALGDFCNWLAATPLSETIRGAGWIIPALQTVHILAVAVLFSSAILVDLRVFRLLQRDAPLPDIVRRFLPAIWPIVLLLLFTGGLLVIGEPRRALLNSTFYLKMALLVVALLLTGALQWILSNAPDATDGDRLRRIGGRLAALASIAVWSGIIFAGRWIAYTQVG